MNLVACGRSCQYQEDGYCQLEQPTVVTDCLEQECVYYVEKHKWRS